MGGYKFDRLRILVVDDNQHMRKLVVTILQAFGTVQIFEAADAQGCRIGVLAIMWRIPFSAQARLSTFLPRSRSISSTPIAPSSAGRASCVSRNKNGAPSRPTFWGRCR